MTLNIGYFSFVLLSVSALAQTPPAAAPRPPARSLISIYDLEKKTTEVVYTAPDVMEAPNWTPDGKYLMINGGGKLFRLAVGVKGAQPEEIHTPTPINNDHAISRDGKLLGLTVRSGPGAGPQTWVAQADGSEPKKLTENYPSYFHAWSPDGKWMAFTGGRNGNYDLYRVAVTGGEEQRLTSHAAYDDGADYSPDGKWIYWNSDRTGNFDIWRMPAAGAGPDDKLAQQVTSDAQEDWFPHPSPDGKWMLVISFEPGTKGHPPNKTVQLRIMPLPGAKLKKTEMRVVTTIFGGQGTINVNSWSPDSKKFAFVSYELKDGGK